MKPKRKARVSQVEMQILQNQGAIMLALRLIIEGTFSDNFIRSINVGTLEDAIKNTGETMKQREVLAKRGKA